ncbi:hypothetical protein EYF80_023200 [Liparis tanakae]|uniref:Uncharacterized protein n=1 Tax=Liparis tanakae TaxID=230148 RepID=A0A4Z2HNH9_9TELE|nr:hypothetical protein EYF80_023200 [Liparis tanakae]
MERLVELASAWAHSAFTMHTDACNRRGRPSYNAFSNTEPGNVQSPSDPRLPGEQVWGYTFGDTAEKSLIMVGVGNFLLLPGGLEPDEEERDRLKEASLLASDGSLGLGPSRL